MRSVLLAIAVSVVCAAPANAQRFFVEHVAAPASTTAAIAQSGQFSVFAALLAETSYATLVEAREDLVIVAPTDAAFSGLAPANLLALQRSRAAREALIARCLIPTQPPEDRDQWTSRSISGAAVTLDMSDGVRVNGELAAVQAGLPGGQVLLGVNSLRIAQGAQGVS